MKFKNKIGQHDINFHEQSALDNLRKAMLDMNIRIIENDDIVFDCNDTPDLTMFRYNNGQSNGESAAYTKSEFNIVNIVLILRLIYFVEIHLNHSPISPPLINNLSLMSDVIRPKRQTFKKWLQGPKLSSKLHVQPIKPKPLNIVK